MTSAVETVAGTIISICASAPATFDAAGYQSTDLVFTAIGEITDGGEHGREYALVTHNPMATRGVQKFKGSFNEGSKTIQMALDRDDAGQVICQTALTSDANYSFKVAYQGGDIDFFQAKVMSFKKATGGVDSMRSATIMLELTTNSSGVGIVEVTAP